MRKKKKANAGSATDLPSVKDYKFKNMVELWEVKATRSLSQLRKLLVDGKVTTVYQNDVRPGIGQGYKRVSYVKGVKITKRLYVFR